MTKRAELAAGRLRKKLPPLPLALAGHGTEPHRELWGRLLSPERDREHQREPLSVRIAHRLDELRPALAQAQRAGIPGVKRTTIEHGRAASGVDRSVCPDEPPRASGCGSGPGNEASAGTRLRSRSRTGNRWRRRARTAAARAASHGKDRYVSAQDRRLAGRRGKQRARVAVGHTLRVIRDRVLKDGVAYHELGPHDGERREPARLPR